MPTGPVVYSAGTVIGPATVKTVRYVGTTALVRGAVVRYVPQATFAAFTLGPGLDVDLFPGTPVQAQFAGVIEEDSVGSTGGPINIVVPHVGTVVWVKVTAGTDNTDGLRVQEAASSATQGLLDSGAYNPLNDIGYCLMDADAVDNPFLTDEMAPVLFTYGTIASA